MSCKVEGYKINNYNATFDRATFEIRERYKDSKSRVLEITDINSGQAFIFDYNDFAQQKKQGKQH